MSLLEVTIAGVLLGVLLTVCLQLMGASAAGRRAVEARQTALVEASNVMERLSAQPWETLAAEKSPPVELSAWAKKSLPGGRLDVEVTPSGQTPEARRIAVAVQWQDAAGRLQRPVRLVAWRYRGQEDKTISPENSSDPFSIRIDRAGEEPDAP